MLFGTRMLIISHVVPVPPRAGNELRIYRMARWLRSRGVELTFLFNHPSFGGARLEEIEQGLGTVRFVGDVVGGVDRRSIPMRLFAAGRLVRRCTDAAHRRMTGRAFNAAKHFLSGEELVLGARILAASERFDMVLAEYIFPSRCLDQFGRTTLKIIDTHDLFSRKAEEVVKYGIQDSLVCSVAEERTHLLRSDLVIAIQEKEAAMLKTMVPERQVVTAGIDFAVCPGTGGEEPKGAGKAILIVASSSIINVAGVRDFLVHALPLVRRRLPHAVVNLVGAVCGAVDTADGSVRKIGVVGDLGEWYRGAGVVVNPVMAGTGLKIKSVEALCHGKALISFPNGVEGMRVGGEEPFLVVDTWEDLAAAVCRMIEDEELRRHYERRAADYARRAFSEEVVYGELEKALVARMGRA